MELRKIQEDGYLNIFFPESRNIIYHASLNVILVFNKKNEVKVIDVHSGIVLQSYILSDDDKTIHGRYLPLQDKILFWDGKNIGLRGDYTGVLLLDTILQTPVEQNEYMIKIEMLLNEAILFHQSLQNLEEHGVECPSDVVNELMEKIKEGQSNIKKGVKAQRWNTICLELPHSSLKLVANNVVFNLKRLERHIPALAIASAINERLTDLLCGSRIVDTCNPDNCQRFLMYSEAARRQTFEKWPHMDYKWALPDQMAQAGFYHQPSVNGEDRAMCFTCNVCLVSWEKTDEPWSEHERHSPSCPFVKGEYTQNVPLSVTYATNPAIQTPGFDIISNSEYTHVLCTSNTQTGEITIWSIERQLKIMHQFKISNYTNMMLPEIAAINDTTNDKTHINSINVNAICALPRFVQEQQQNMMMSASSTTWKKSSPAISVKTNIIGSQFIVGVSIETQIDYDDNDDDYNERENKSSRNVTNLYLMTFEIVDGSENCSSSIDEQNNNSNSNSSNSISKTIESPKKIQDISSVNESVGGGAGGGGVSGSSSGKGTTNMTAITTSIDQQTAASLDDYVEIVSVDPIIDSSNETTVSKMFSESLGVDGATNYMKLSDMICEVYSTESNHHETPSLSMNYIEDELTKIDSITCKLLQNTEKLFQETQKIKNESGITDLKITTTSTTDNDFTTEINVIPINWQPIIFPMNDNNDEYRDIKIKEILALPRNQILVHVQFSEENHNDSEENKTIDNDVMMKDHDNDSENTKSLLLIYSYDENGIINSYPITFRTFSNNKEPKEMCILPVNVSNNGNNLYKANNQTNINSNIGTLCLICADGSLELININDLQTVMIAKRDNEDEKFVSATFCKSLERLCACTNKGCLIFYSLHDDDLPDEIMNSTGNLSTIDNNENMNTEMAGVELEDFCEIDGGERPKISTTKITDQKLSCNQTKSQFISTSTATATAGGTEKCYNNSNCLLANKNELKINDLRDLYSLTLFEDELTPYTAEVPNCWNELIQAQKQRRNPQSSRLTDDSNYAKTWRLHNDATTWDEHLIELSLPKPSSLGHIDFRFSLYQQCPNPPAIQVTLLKQNTYGFSYRMKPPNSSSLFASEDDTASVDDNIEFPLSANEGTNENPVLCDEYLQAHKAEILAGPVELSSCMDLCDQGGLVTLTSPKLFKTRAKNFLLHIKTMTDPSKEGRSKTRVPVKKRGIMRCLFSSFTNSENLSCPTSTKQSRNDYYIGCDWLHEISIAVRSTKQNSNIPNERAQRIAMLESNNFIDNLIKIMTNPKSTNIQINLSLDILNWICSIRLMRFRSPKLSMIDRLKQQQYKINEEMQQKQENSSSQKSSNFSNNFDFQTQQKECILIIEKNLEYILEQCALRGNRNISNKTVKLILLVSDGVRNLPQDLQSKITFNASLMKAIITCIPKLHQAKYASAIRWFSLLVCAVASSESHQSISEACINLLVDITKEMQTRWSPYCSILNSRFGLYGSPFEPILFDTELPQFKNRNSNTPSTLVNIIKSNTGIAPQSSSMDLKKLSSIDGIEFRSFPHLIRAKSINNQLRGLLEVEPLHFTCFAASEATRIETIDSLSSTSTSASNINIEDLIVTPPQNQNHIHAVNSSIEILYKNKDAQYDIVNNMKNILVDKLVTFTKKKYGTATAATLQKNDDDDEKSKPNGFVEHLENTHNGSEKLNKYNLPKIKAICKYIEQYDENFSSEQISSPDKNSEAAVSNDWKYASDIYSGNFKDDDKTKTTTTSSATPIEENNHILPWHKLLVPPPKQMVVIERINSGARRFVVIDFGSPIVLTDLVIPACDELSSLFIDIWCFDEEKDGIRLVATQDIGVKTLVLSDIQPAPICRFMRITIVGRYGMSATRCKFPIGTFYGHLIVLDSDTYAANNSLNCMKASPSNIKYVNAQIKTLNSLYEDVNCRHNLSCNKLIELLKPLLKGDLSNLAHMHAFVSKQQKDYEFTDLSTAIDNNKIMSLYEECTTLQHQMNLIRNVIHRLENSINEQKDNDDNDKQQQKNAPTTLKLVSKDKLRVLSESLIEILLHLSIEYGVKNVFSLHSYFTMDVANRLFNTLVVCGDGYIQLSTCSLLVRMCCFQSWWGDFVANIFCNLFSSQNTKVFPQDRIFFLLTYLGRRSIAMGSCRSIIIDAILKTIAKLLAPISPRYDRTTTSAASAATTDGGDSDCIGAGGINNSGIGGVEIENNLWLKTDLQLITWLILFLSICLDENNSDKRDKSANRWEFMSCEADFTKSRTQSANNNGKNFQRCLKKRNIQQTKYNGLQPYTDWGKKIYMLQNELPEIFMELTGKTKATKPTAASSSSSAGGGTSTMKSNSSSSSSSSGNQRISRESTLSSESNDNNSFNNGLRSIKFTNIIVVIRGLIALILEMDFTVNMDLFLLTCKVVARLVSACRPSIQLSKVVTTQQLEQLIRLAVWNDQQQPWAVHAITCLLQDLLDADKNFKETYDTMMTDVGGCGCSGGGRSGEDVSIIIPVDEIIETAAATDNESSSQMHHNSHVVKDISYADTVRYGQLPSLIECEDNEIDELLNELDNLDRTVGSNGNGAIKNLKKDGTGGISLHNKNSLNFFCKGISSALDSRLNCGLDTNIQILIRRLTMMSSLDLYTSLPQVPSTDIINTPVEQIPAWPEYIINAWSGPEYNCGIRTYQMFRNVFDSIFTDLHLQDTWVHLQQVLQIWLTLNSELSDKPYSNSSNLNHNSNNVPKIPFGPNAVEGLLMALAWHNDIKLHTWCLGFQCLILACNIHSNLDKNDEYLYDQKIGYVIIMDENFEKMLLRFFSGHGMNSPTAANRCVGPTICKYLHELLLWLQMKAEFANQNSNIKRKLKNTLLNVVLQLTQPGGAIYNQQGPIDAQSQLIRDLISIQYDKADLTIAMNIIESVSFLVFNNIANSEKIQCRRLPDMNNSNNAFGSLFATVLGSDNSKQNMQVSDNSLIISLLKLCSSLVQTELKCRDDELNINLEMENESQTDEIKAEQLNNEQKKKGGSFVVDQVLLHFQTMKRLLSSLSHCSSSSFTMLTPSTTAVYSSMKSTSIDINSSINEPQTTADAVFHLLMLLCEKASHPKLIVTPIFHYLEANSSQRNVLPRLLLSEPLIWYILKVLDTPSTVSIFNELGGIRIICQNLVQCKRFLVNMQPGLISLIMQHMTKNSNLNDFTTTSSSSKKSSSQLGISKSAQERLVNFAPFCSITSENTTAQPANVLLQAPMNAHRRARTPAWTYMFYPNESHVDLTIQLPTAILLYEIQIQPHVPTLATCPSAVAVEISRDNGLGPIPFGQALTTAGMTCIRLKLSRPEIATGIVLRLYRPKDNSSIALNQISVLGTTIFRTTTNNRMGSGSEFLTSNIGEDSLAKTSIGWIRILARCFSVATFNPDSDISKSVISSAIQYPGFLESCCSLMNIMPSSSSSASSSSLNQPTIIAMQNLETVLLKLAEYSKDVFLSLIKILLYDTVPQTYRLCNDAICDLLYDLCTRKDNFVLEKINVLLNWIIKLRQNYGNGSSSSIRNRSTATGSTTQQRCTNPQCGFIKCVASILWTIYTENTLSAIPNLPDVIQIHEAFESCLYWIDILEDKEALKVAFDSLLCSLCCIKPELFNVLLKRVGVAVVTGNQTATTLSVDHQSMMMDPHHYLPSTSSSASTSQAGTTTEGITDDNKTESGSEWFKNVAAQNLSQLLQKPMYLDTLAAACQSPMAIYQLVDSGLPKMLSYALYEYCCSFSTTSNIRESTTLPNEGPSSASSSCLTDSDKVENNVEMMTDDNSSATANISSEPNYYQRHHQTSLISINHVPQILDFFTECCSEGYMRDWLGSYQGSIFWKPLLELLSNYQQKQQQLSSSTTTGIDSNIADSADSEPEESVQQAFIQMERSAINFFSKVTACHPKNQETLTSILISVISQPKQKQHGMTVPSSSSTETSFINNNKNNYSKSIISGFTRRLVLQLLLESERILISVQSKLSMQKKDTYYSHSTTTTLINNHPSKRINNHHLLFYLSTNTTCQEILQNCMSVYNNILPSTTTKTTANENNNQTKQQTECTNSTTATTTTSGNYSGNGNGAQSSSSSSENASVKGIFDLEFANMELLSVAAGVTAKDKRLKDVKNQHAAAAAASAYNSKKELFPKFIKYCSIPKDDTTMMNSSSNGCCNNPMTTTNFVELIYPDCPDVVLTNDTTISQILAMLYNRGFSLSTPCLNLTLIPSKDYNELTMTSATSAATSSSSLIINDPSSSSTISSRIKCSSIEPLSSPLQRFSSRGGLLLLAHYLPTVYPDCTSKSSLLGNYVMMNNNQNDKEKSPPMSDWVKVESNDDVYEDLEETLAEASATSSKCQAAITSVPHHSLAAFGLFLRLPAYSDVLLRDKIKAQCLLRLVLGVTGDGEGNDIYSLSLASTLPTLPFEVFRQLLDSSPLTTDDGLLLRRMTIEVGAMHLILNYLGIFTHQSQTYQLNGPHNDCANGVKSVTNKDDNQIISDDKSHVYWAKGTGFGTGSTQKSWDVEQALLRQKSEEEHVTVLLQVLSSYINPGDKIPRTFKCDDDENEITDCQDQDMINDDDNCVCDDDDDDDDDDNDDDDDGIIDSDVPIGDQLLPSIFTDLLQQSCLIPALSSYLRNDSVLDITRHIPLYRSILQLLRAISISKQLQILLRPSNENGSSDLMSIASLLANMKRCVDTYAKRLKVNKKSNIKGQTQKVTVNIDDGDDEGLALLIPDIQETTYLVQKATYTLSSSSTSTAADSHSRDSASGSSNDNGSKSNAADGSCFDIERPISSISIEQKYLEVMKTLQFDSYDMIVESDNGFRFVVSHHFENNVRMAGDRGYRGRTKRLAQEAVTISTSLPLSYSSSVFVRCDTDRMDIMKVLITGPADTPYANGCFEFDVYFPPDYPTSPMLINLETTGRHSVRFNPNLYNDGKVCLSVLNTWHGRPEEKWNAQTSSFLQVLVSIQSLILVPEPYFNEPGFERSRGTSSGTYCSKEYNSNIYQACVRWAMLEQIRNPSPCFKEVIHTHFWLKRHEICAQIENWLDELNKPQYNEKSGRTISFNAMVLRRQYRQLREELAKLQPPKGLENFKLPPFNANTSSFDSMTSSTTITTATTTTTTTVSSSSVASSSTITTTIIPTTSINTVSTTSSTIPQQQSVNMMSNSNEIGNMNTISNLNPENSKILSLPSHQDDDIIMKDVPTTTTTTSTISNVFDNINEQIELQQQQQQHQEIISENIENSDNGNDNMSLLISNWKTNNKD